jgi:hypothetical protein
LIWGTTVGFGLMWIKRVSVWGLITAALGWDDAMTRWWVGGLVFEAKGRKVMEKV